MPTSVIRQRAGSRLPNVESLLFPLAMLLKAGGLSMKEAESTFSSVFRKALKRPSLKTHYIGHPTRYADIIGLWTKDKRFVTAGGHPRLLRARGRNSITTLVQEASPTSDAQSVLSVLLRYGNVRRSKDGKYKLARPFFLSENPNSIAFEPTAFFLADASVTLGRILSRQRRSGDPSHFWRKVETANLSDALARKFSMFAKERALLFLEELDDWLDAHKSSNRTKRTRRVGLGIFSIFSDREVIDTAP